MLGICKGYSTLYVWKQKHFVQKKNEKKNKKKQKRKASFLPFAAKKAWCECCSVLDDFLLGQVYSLTRVGLWRSRKQSVAWRGVWGHVMIWGIVWEHIIAWLWRARCLGYSYFCDRIGVLPGQGPCDSFVCGLKKRVLIPGPLHWSWCWPPLASWSICLQ